MKKDRKERNDEQRKPEELTAKNRVALKERKEDLPARRRTEPFGASKLQIEVNRLLQVMMPTVSPGQMTITSGPESIRHQKVMKDGKEMYKAYRHTAVDAQAVKVESGQQVFKKLGR